MKILNILLDNCRESDRQIGKQIGITGGVAYNQFITSHIAKKVRKANLEFIEHKDLPCGDGAISCGQAIVSALRNRM